METNADRGVEISSLKKSLVVGEASIDTLSPTPGSEAKTFELCVLNRWVFTFCVHGTLLPLSCKTSDTRERGDMADISGCDSLVLALVVLVVIA